MPNKRKVVDENSVRLIIKRLPRILSSRLRLLPDFIIIGAQRAGTTSLYNYIINHPWASPAFIKEVHYFDNNFHHGTDWYRAFFPTILYKQYKRIITHNQFVTGESSPFYLCHPHAARRIKTLLPEIKLIVILRNPVDRAYSHYHHHVQLGIESLSFEEAISQEPNRLTGEYEHMVADHDYYSYNYQAYSYLTRGIYADQLTSWFSFFDSSQLLILDFAGLQKTPQNIMGIVNSFLGLPSRELREYPKFHESSYLPMKESTRQQLNNYFMPHNHRLSQITGMEYNW